MIRGPSGRWCGVYSHLARAYCKLRPGHPHNLLSLRECRKLLAEVGFVIERVYPLGLLHIPYINLPHAIYRTADRLASTSERITACSESPIIVARRSVNRG